MGLFLFIGWILWLVGWLMLFNFSVEELREVIGEDDEGGLHLLGIVARSPSFELVEFVFDFIKALLDAPAYEVELGN